MSDSDSDYDKKLKRFLLPILRRRSLYWTGRQEAKREARIDRGFYQCKSCKNAFGHKEVEMDHIHPVINVKTSWTSWDNYIRSLYCDKSNFSCLCKACHLQKTQTENALRSINKKKLKKKKK